MDNQIEEKEDASAQSGLTDGLGCVITANDFSSKPYTDGYAAAERRSGNSCTGHNPYQSHSRDSLLWVMGFDQWVSEHWDA